MIDLLLALVGLAALSMGVLLSLAITLPVVRRRALGEGYDHGHWRGLMEGRQEGWEDGYSDALVDVQNSRTKRATR